MLTEKLQQNLDKQRNKHLYRNLDIRTSSQGAHVMYRGKSYLSFCSNDYLGLANHPDVIQSFKQAADIYGVGSGASHLLGGHCDVHHLLEQELAAYLNYPAVLLFSTGYMANLGVINTLAQEGDLLIQDHNNHASLIDAGLLARGEMRRYKHNNLKHLENILKIIHNKNTIIKNKFIVTQGIFSMTGELAPLPAITELAKSHKAWLIVDDAHGIGCLGKTGRGTLEHYGLSYKDVPVLIGTLGKALGSFGAFVAGDLDLIEALRQFARSYIYTTALPPAVCAATRTSLELITSAKENWRPAYLQSLIQEFRRGANNIGLDITPSITAIQSLKIGDENKALILSNKLYERGILIKAIRSPTVPLSQACLRISLSAAHTKEHIKILLENLDSIDAI